MTARQELPELLQHHFEHLQASAISIEVLKQRGYRSVSRKGELGELGFSKSQQRVPGILIPLWGVYGKVCGYQYRPDNPRLNSRGKPIKYETPYGAANTIDCPPQCQGRLGDPTVPLWIVEGTKKADSLASHGLAAISLKGVFGWRGKNKQGGTTALANWESVTLKGRKLVLCFDSDTATNENVALARSRLAHFLASRGGVVKIATLPQEGENKIGPDDFLATHTTHELEALVQEYIPELPKEGGGYLYYDEKGVHLDMGKLVSDLCGEFGFKTFPDTGEVLVYSDGVYVHGGEAKIYQECEERLGAPNITSYQINEVAGHIQRSTYVVRPEFNKDGGVLNLVNGLYVIRTGELIDHRAEFLSTIRIPVAYDPDADCPLIKKFFSEVLRPENIPVIEEFFGYCLIPAHWIQRLVLCIGDGGNGKSTLLELLRAFLGSQNCSHLSLQQIEAQRFALASLYGKLANIHADIPSKPLKYTGWLKMLTGGDTISAEKKFKEPFSFVNHAKLIFSTNKPPKVIDEDSFAFWRRWILINFPNKFVGDNADKLILAKMTTRDELSGLLNVALQGLDRLLRSGDFSYLASADEVAEQYRKESDPIYAFIEDMCEPDLEGWVSKDNLYQAFAAYCDNQHISKLGKESFGRQLKNTPNAHVVARQRRVSGELMWGWHGIKVVTDKPVLDMTVTR